MKKWKFLLPAAGIVAIGAIAASIYCSQTEYGNEYIIDQQGNKVVDQYSNYHCIFHYHL